MKTLTKSVSILAMASIFQRDGDVVGTHSRINYFRNEKNSTLSTEQKKKAKNQTQSATCCAKNLKDTFVNLEKISMLIFFLALALNFLSLFFFWGGMCK